MNPLACSHQTCYRTCITEDPFFEIEECTACDVNNEPIEVVAPQDSELQNTFTNRIILSPNFPNEFYPDSIQCRYSNKSNYYLFFLFNLHANIKHVLHCLCSSRLLSHKIDTLVGFICGLQCSLCTLLVQPLYSSICISGTTYVCVNYTQRNT